jgi:hypothetical protein
MAAYKPNRRRSLLPLVTGLAGAVLLSTSLWQQYRKTLPTHQIQQVPEPYRSHIVRGTFPRFTKTEEYNGRQEWQQRVNSQTSPSFSDDSRFILTALGEQLRLYDVASGKLVRDWRLPSVSGYTTLSVYTAPGENRWYVWRYENVSGKGQVYTLTPTQTTLGEPLLGLSDVRFVSHSGRFVLGNAPALYNTYGPTLAQETLVHDRQTRKTYPLAIPTSSSLNLYNLVHDSRDPVVYGHAEKSSEYLFFSLETGKRLPTPDWLAASKPTLCRFLKDTILTGETDGTLNVRSRETPTKILKSYPTAIRRFERLGITRDQRFIIAEGADHVDTSQGGNWVSMVLDTTDKKPARTFLRTLTPYRPPSKDGSAAVVTTLPRTRTEDVVRLYWNGAYVRDTSWYKDNRLTDNVSGFGDLNTGREISLGKEASLFNIAIPWDKASIAWTDRKSGDLMIWLTPLAPKK